MRLIERMNTMIQIRRRRIETPSPPVQFAIGVAPAPRNPPPRIHYCKKGSITPPTIKPLVIYAPHIPYDCMVSVLMTGTSIKDHAEFIELQRKSIACIHPPEMRITLLESLQQKEEWLRTEIRCRVAFRNLVRHWLWKRYASNDLNTEDPATLSEPIQPIRVFDVSARGTYIFEAASLRKSMERDLNYCDWLFPEPSHPKNPFTNLPFHAGHRIHILQQLRVFQQGSWILESYHQMKWQLKPFRDIFLVPLKMRALQEICRNPTSEETIDYLLEYIEDHYDYHEIHQPLILTVLRWATKHMTTDPYMLKWLDSFRQYYSIQIIYGELFLENNHTLRNTLYTVTHDLLKQIKQINRLAKIRNERIAERRQQQAAAGQRDPQPLPSQAREIETIHGPVTLISEFQTIHLPLVNPIVTTVTAAARFELGDTNIDVLTERISHLVDSYHNEDP